MNAATAIRSTSAALSRHSVPKEPTLHESIVLQRYDNVVGRWAKKSDGSESLTSLTSEKKMKRIGELG